MQRNWIGRSEGVEFDLPVVGDERDGLVLRVFTTRPDTSFGMTYAVVAPEHPLVDVLTTDAQRPEVEELRAAAARQERARPDVVRGGGRAPGQARGAFTGGHVVNPFTGEEIPVYVADYVLMRYGTGAIMAVPAEDDRDWDFARAHGLPVVRTTQPPEGFDGGAWTGDGRQDQLGLPRRPGRRRRQGARHRMARGARNRAPDRQLPPARLVGVAPALLGMSRSPSSTAPTTASSGCPRTSCPSWPPTTSSSSRPGSHR